MTKRTRPTEDPETRDTDRYLAEEPPALSPSRQQELDHAPDEDRSDYYAYGQTRIGIGSGGGDVAKLIRHNEGRHPSDGNHSVREAARDKKRITESFCSRLDVTPYQQQRAIAAMGSLNLDRFGRQKRLEKVALGTIKVIVEWDRSYRLRQSPNLANLDDELVPPRVLESDRYCDLLEDQGVSRKDLFSVSQLVKRELKKRNYFESPSKAGGASGVDGDDTGPAPQR